MNYRSRDRQREGETEERERVGRWRDGGRWEETKKCKWEERLTMGARDKNEGERGKTRAQMGWWQWWRVSEKGEERLNKENMDSTPRLPKDMKYKEEVKREWSGSLQSKWDKILGQLRKLWGKPVTWISHLAVVSPGSRTDPWYTEAKHLKFIPESRDAWIILTLAVTFWQTGGLYDRGTADTR